MRWGGVNIWKEEKRVWAEREWDGNAYIEVSVHTVPVTSAPETTWAGMAAAREAESAARMTVEIYMMFVSSLRKVLGIKNRCLVKIPVENICSRSEY
jgi:hypothetical protein